MQTIKIYQMQDTEVTVTVYYAFSEVKVDFIDRQGNPVELYMDMESGLRVIRDFDRFKDVQKEFNTTLKERAKDPLVIASWIACAAAWVTLIYFTL